MVCECHDGVEGTWSVVDCDCEELCVPLRLCSEEMLKESVKDCDAWFVEGVNGDNGVVQ